MNRTNAGLYTTVVYRGNEVPYSPRFADIPDWTGHLGVLNGNHRLLTVSEDEVSRSFCKRNDCGQSVVPREMEMRRI